VSAQGGGRLERGLAFIVLLGAVAAFVGQGRAFIVAKAPTIDELLYVPTGYAYLKLGDLELNRQHPPLVKYLLGLPNVLLSRQPIELSKKNEWVRAHEFLGSIGPEREVFFERARFGNLALGVMLLGLVFLFAWRLWGPRAAAAAVVLAAFDPSVVAYFADATLDGGTAFFFLLVLWVTWEWTRAKTPGWLAAVGFASGLALCTKFSTAAFVGASVVPVIIWETLRGRGLDRPALVATARRILAVAAVALVAVALVYRVIDFNLYFRGFGAQMSHSKHGHAAYFFGAYSLTGWWDYFVVTLLVKLPLGTQMLAVLSLALYRRGRRLEGRDALLLGLGFVSVVAAITASRIDIGVRYVLPALVLVPLVAARVATIPGRENGRLLGVVAAALAVWAAADGVRATPDQMAYFNELAGGVKGGHRYFTDSSVDWGQDHKPLAAWAAAQPSPLLYADLFCASLGAYPLPTLLEQAEVSADPAALLRAAAGRDLVAISSFQLISPIKPALGYVDWARDWPLVDNIGGSILVYDITDRPDAYAALATHFELAGLQGDPQGRARAALVLARGRARHPGARALSVERWSRP
jgi:hypothetical protein